MTGGEGEWGGPPPPPPPPSPPPPSPTYGSGGGAPAHHLAAPWMHTSSVRSGLLPLHLALLSLLA
eukprot:8844342-Pyramimonas_sp.AAC.1